jgi:hypothetical protein
LCLLLLLLLLLLLVLLVWRGSLLGNPVAHC